MKNLMNELDGGARKLRERWIIRWNENKPVRTDAQMKEIGRRDSTKFTLLRLEEVFVSKFPSIFESRVEKVKAPPLSNRIEQPSSKSTLRLSHAVSRIQYLNDFRSTLLTSTESTVAVERMERRNLLEPLPEPSTFFLRLFSSLSLSLGIYPLGLHCVYLRKLARPRAATFLPTVWAGCNDYRSSCASRNRCPRQNRSPSFLSSLSRFEEGSNNEESRDTQKRWRPRRLEEFK